MSKSQKSPAALQMLMQDHEKVQKAFKEFEMLDASDEQACRQLVLGVCQDLRVHTTLEEEVFYPAVRDAIDDDELMNEAAVEHETAKMLIEQLENMDGDDPNFHATFTVLGEYVRHHIKEEEAEMFPAAGKTALDLEALGAEMRARRAEIEGEFEKTHA